MNNLLKNTNKMLFGNIVRSLLQATYFIVLAKELGVEGFGVYTLILSVLTIFGAFEALGLGNYYLMMRSRNDWDSTKILPIFILYIVFGVFLVFISCVVFLVFFDLDLYVIMLFSISELIFFSLSSFFNQHFQSIGKYFHIVLVNFIYGFVRVVFLFLFLEFIDGFNLTIWSLGYFLSSMTAFFLSFIAFFEKENFILENSIRNCFNIFREIRISFHFSISRISSAISSECDKLILQFYTDSEALGAYGLAMRFINLANMPIISLFSVCYPIFFKKGKNGICCALLFGVKVFILIICYLFLVYLIYFYTHELAISLVGNEFSMVFYLLPYLLVYPLLRAIKTVLADTLSGSSYQDIRSKVSVAMLFITIGFQVLLMSEYLLMGVIYALLLSELFSIVLYIFIIVFLVRKENESFNN